MNGGKAIPLTIAHLTRPLKARAGQPIEPSRHREDTLTGIQPHPQPADEGRALTPEAIPQTLLGRDETGSKTDELCDLRARWSATAYVGDTGSSVRHAHPADMTAIAVA
ncbi:hypothetical protein [Streptomyces parvulus]|uniref:hypothetical protein n=1 Tax=Streptomyces parvulus TaxID=146923 RepID=UPI0037A974B0